MSLAVSITETDADPSFETYANGAAAATTLSAACSSIAAAKQTQRLRQVFMVLVTSRLIASGRLSGVDQSAILHNPRLFATTIEREEPMNASRRLRATLTVLCAVAANGTAAQPQPPTAVLDPLVVTATRSAERAFDLPVAIDVIDAKQIQQGQLQINLSESL
ncbi:MAG TPA: hypothetical protein VGO25_14240, partial [Rhodanobacteraceae bacterium]|nr:hypothetical protein [Rhodanobacteraceae bacterium]